MKKLAFHGFAVLALIVMHLDALAVGRDSARAR